LLSFIFLSEDHIGAQMRRFSHVIIGILCIADVFDADYRRFCSTSCLLVPKIKVFYSVWSSAWISA